jgi:hypothetical protein
MEKNGKSVLIQMLFVILIGWIIGCSVLWFYMGWFDLESGKGFFDPDFIWKN